MWSPASNKGPPGGAAPAAHARRLTALALAGLVPMALAACSSEPARTAPRPAPPLAQPAAHATAAPPAVTAGAAGGAPPAPTPAPGGALRGVKGPLPTPLTPFYPFTAFDFEKKRLNGD